MAKITKAYSYADAEQQVPRSPAKPQVREWASGSYDPQTGRGHIFNDGGRRSRQVPDEGPRGKISGSTPSSRPGRW